MNSTLNKSSESPTSDQASDFYYYSPDTMPTTNPVSVREADEDTESDRTKLIPPLKDQQNQKVMEEQSNEDSKSPTNKHRFMRFTL